jgi:hypothetical protein
MSDTANIWDEVVEDEVVETEVEETENEETEVEETEVETEVEEEEPKQSKPSEIGAEIAKAIREAMPQVSAAEKPSEKPQLSQEEIEQHLAVWKPDAAFLQEFQEALLDETKTPEERLKAVIKMRDGLIKQSQTYAQLVGLQVMQQLEQKFGPVLSEVTTRQREQTQKAFFSKYPDLKPYAKVVPVVAKELGARLQGQNVADPGKVLAEAVAEHIKAINPNFELKVAPTRRATPAKTLPSRAGSGGTPRASSGKSADIWD